MPKGGSAWPSLDSSRPVARGDVVAQVHLVSSAPLESVTDEESPDSSYALIRKQIHYIHLTHQSSGTRSGVPPRKEVGRGRERTSERLFVW
jgi:hypothetical protein